MFSRKRQADQHVPSVLEEEEESWRSKEGSTPCGSEKNVKRVLILSLLILSIIMVWLLMMPNPTKNGPMHVWTEQNTRYSKRESIFPPSDEVVVLPRLSFNPTLMGLLDDDWTSVMRNNKIIGIDFEFNKGFSEKFRVVFDSGHVAVAKPIISAEEVEAGLYQQIQTIDINTIPEEKRNGKHGGLLDTRIIQGWAEVAAFHLDRVLGFYMKPTITARMFDNHFWFSFDSSVRSLRYRNADTFEYPMALIAWLDNVKSAEPDWETIGRTLVMDRMFVESEWIASLRSTSDVILFDFLIDDHDKHNVQNWKEWRFHSESHPLIWDSGLGWAHGPFSKPDCKNLLCGPKEWREKEPGWDDNHCRHICRFNANTIQKLRSMDSGQEESLGKQLDKSLQKEDLYPIFEYGEFKAKKVGGSEALSNLVHFIGQNFFDGMDYKVKLLLEHVDQCIVDYGEENVLL